MTKTKQTDQAQRVATILRLAREAKINISVSTYSWDHATPYHCEFEATADDMQASGKGSSLDLLDAIVRAWEKFERLTLLGAKQMLVPQLEARTRDEEEIDQ